MKLVTMYDLEYLSPTGQWVRLCEPREHYKDIQKVQTHFQGKHRALTRIIVREVEQED